MLTRTSLNRELKHEAMLMHVAVFAAVLVAVSAVAATQNYQLHVTVDVNMAQSGPLRHDFASFSVETPCPKPMMYNNGQNDTELVLSPFL